MHQQAQPEKPGHTELPVITRKLQLRNTQHFNVLKIILCNLPCKLHVLFLIVF
jgi:hypothetical protein